VNNQRGLYPLGLTGLLQGLAIADQDQNFISGHFPKDHISLSICPGIEKQTIQVVIVDSGTYSSPS
jgi:hypothetical protein